MKRFRFSKRSKDNLRDVHPHLIDLATLALELSEVDFVVIEGARTLERQRSLVDAGSSWTMNSRHVPKLTNTIAQCHPMHGKKVSHAIDIVPWVGGGVRWDWPLYYELAEAFDRASFAIYYPYEWGGRWPPQNHDGQHFQLPWRDYP